MRKFILSIMLLLSFQGLIYADDPCQTTSGPYGPMTCSGGITASVSANGPVTMTDTIVQNDTQVNGTLDAEKATFNNLTVNGKVVLHDSLIKGLTDINGDLKAFKSNFSDTLTLSTNGVELYATHTADIIIDNSGSGIVSPQTLTLKEGSLVDGNVTFKAEDGIVYVGPKSSIIGKVIGGKIVHIEQPAKTAQPAKANTAAQ